MGEFRAETGKGKRKMMQTERKNISKRFQVWNVDVKCGPLEVSVLARENDRRRKKTRNHLRKINKYALRLAPLLVRFCSGLWHISNSRFQIINSTICIWQTVHPFTAIPISYTYTYILQAAKPFKVVSRQKANPNKNERQTEERVRESGKHFIYCCASHTNVQKVETLPTLRE